MGCYRSALFAPLAPLLLALLFLQSPLRGAWGQPVQSDTPGAITGTLTSVDVHGPRQVAPAYYLHAISGTIFRVSFCASISEDAIPVGSKVTVVYDKIVDGVVQSCAVPTVPAAEPRPNRRSLKLGDWFETPYQARILVYIATFCGFPEPAAVTPKQVTDLFITGNGTYQNRSLAGYIKTCSFNQVSFSAADFKVLGPVQVPCKGSLKDATRFATGPDFTSLACDELDNMPKWHHWLDEWALKTHGVTASDYHQRVIIFPRMFIPFVKGCGGFAGAATPGKWSYGTGVNNWGSSLIWWSGDNFGDLEILLHEIGHTYGMAHANTQTSCSLYDQCDHTCTMGAAGGQGIRCFNAPHNWQVGWARPFDSLHDGNFLTGYVIPIRIPPQLIRFNNFLLVTGSGMPTGQHLFISARINTYPYDLSWPSWDDNKPYIVMHKYNGTEERPGIQTVFVGEIGLNSTWRDSNSNVVIRFISWDSTSGAIVLICRRRDDRGTEAVCHDGRDDDCDFLPDVLDPDCPPAPPPSPRPPKPPPKPKRPPPPSAPKPKRPPPAKVAKRPPPPVVRGA